MNFETDTIFEEQAVILKYNIIKESYSGLSKEIIVSHVGELTHGKVSELIVSIESTLNELNSRKSIAKRLVSVVVEVLQNALLHGQKSSNAQHSYFFLTRSQEGYEIISANLIKNAEIENVKLKLESVKSMDEEALKRYYMDILSNGKLSLKGGAGLGIITIALKSSNHIEFKFDNINEHYSLFILQIQIAE